MLQQLLTTPEPPAARRAVDVRWSVRSRRLAGGAATLIAIIGVVLADIDLGPTARVAFVLAAVAFGASTWRPMAVLFDRAGGVVATFIATLLVLGTGGTTSPFADMYAIVLVYSAVVMSWRRLAFDTAVVAVAVILTGVLGRADPAFYVDGVVDLGVWGTISVLAGSLSRRLGAVARRQRADAALVESADTALITTDARGVVRSWNPAATAMYGVAQEEAVGRHIADVVNAPLDDPSRGTARRLDRIQYGTRHHDGHGCPIDVEVTAWPVPTEEGSEAMGMMVRDISSHRRASVQLRQQEERFRVFAEQARGVVYRFEVAPRPRLAYLSPRMRDLLGLDPDAVQADPSVVLSRIHPDDGVPFDLEDGSGRFAEGVHEYRVRHADGSWVWIEDHHQPEHDLDGRLVASQGILYDVSARKQFEEAREQALADAQETARQLERTTLAQTVFLRSVSHQMRTPMTLVRGFAKTLERHGDALDDGARAELTNRLLVAIDRLDEHLSDLLDMQADDDESQMRRAVPVDVGDVCFRAVAAVDTAQHQVAVATTRAEVLGDRSQLVRAVAALLRNAVQHTPPTTAIAVEVRTDDSTVTVRVRDHGPGVDEEIRDRVFEPFVQGRAAATAHSPGSGIGLTLVRQVALRHGGTVRCVPVAPTGAQFELTLPLARHSDAGHAYAEHRRAIDAHMTS